jgi:hypothetical protein
MASPGHAFRGTAFPVAWPFQAMPRGRTSWKSAPVEHALGRYGDSVKRACHGGRATVHSIDAAYEPSV